jgi:hypothetical protein
MCHHLQSVVIENVDRFHLELASVLRLLLPSAGTLARLVYNPNKYIETRKGYHQDKWGHEQHPCALLQLFPKLEYLEATTRPCPDAFLLTRHPFLSLEKCQPPRRREWIFRLPKQRSGTCYFRPSAVCHSRDPSASSSQFTPSQQI